MARKGRRAERVWDWDGKLETGLTTCFCCCRSSRLTPFFAIVGRVCVDVVLEDELGGRGREGGEGREEGRGGETGRDR